MAGDARAVCDLDADAVLLPKVSSPKDHAITWDLLILATMETPRDMLNVPAIAAHLKQASMVMGTNDLCRPR